MIKKYPQNLKKEVSGKYLDEKVRYEILNVLDTSLLNQVSILQNMYHGLLKGRDDLIDKYRIPINEYIHRCVYYDRLWEKLDEDISQITKEPFERSNEYASSIMDGISNNNSEIIYGNVINDGLIENLPENCCVEVPCKIDSSGFNPQKVGKIPEHLAALMRTNINVQILTAEAALTKKERTYISCCYA